jgi:hypothetical protein
MIRALFQNTLVIAVFFVCANTVNAQADSTGSKLSFKIGTYYNSNLNYYGRTDSLKSSGVFPMAELWLNNKFYINAAPIFTFNKSNGFEYAGAVTTAGFLYNNGKSVAHLYLMKPIYKDNSELVQSALKAQTAFNYTWLNKIMNVTLGGDIKFSNSTDFGATVGLDHIFRKELNKGILIVDPSVYLYAGTQKFTETYRQKDNTPLFPGPDRIVTEEVKKFSILSYEISAPVIYSMGKLMLLATPAYVIPQNLIQVENRPDLSEKGEKLFYMTVGAKISF